MNASGEMLMKAHDVAVVGNLERVQNDFEPVKNDCGRVENGFEPIKNDCRGVKNDVESIENDVEPSKNDFGGVQNDIGGVENDVEPIKNDGIFSVLVIFTQKATIEIRKIKSSTDRVS